MTEPSVASGARPTTAYPVQRDAPVADIGETWWDRWWFACCATALVIGSDYKFRTRDPEAALSAAIDSAILLELAIYATVGMYAMFRYGRPPKIRRMPTHVFVACFMVGLIALSTSYATFPDYAIARSAQMCILLVLTLVTSATATIDHFHRWAHLFMVLVVVSVAYGLAVPSVPLSNTQIGRFTWLAIHPTVAGVIAGLGFLLAFSYIAWGGRSRGGPRWPPPFYVVVAVVDGGALLAVHTRGAIAGVVVGAVAILLSVFRGQARWRAVAAALAISLAAVLAAFKPILAYVVRGDSTTQLTTLSSRTDLWAVAADTIELKPLFGYGVGSSRGIFLEDLGLGGAHNAAINVVVELGLVGLVCWALLVATILLAAARLPVRRKPEVRFDRSLLLGLVVFLLVDGFFYEGLGAPANVAMTTLYVCVAWLSVAGRVHAVPNERRTVTDLIARERRVGQ